MKKLEIKKSVLFDVLKKVDSDVRTDYHVGKEDIFVGGLYDVSSPKTRVEVWNMSTRVDVYIGLDTKIFATASSVLQSETAILSAQTSVKRSKNEIVVKFYSLKAFEIFFSNFYTVVEKKEATATKKNSTKKNNKKVSKTA